MSDDVPAWPAAPLLQRLKECRIMLYQHGILTDAEAGKCDVRIFHKERLQERARKESPEHG